MLLSINANLNFVAIIYSKLSCFLGHAHEQIPQKTRLVGVYSGNYAEAKDIFKLNC
jgi:hypothetical protein